jgi:hypothetical protein
MQRMWVVPEEGRTRLLALSKIKWQKAESLRKKNIGNSEGKCEDEEVTQKSNKRSPVSCNSVAEKHLFFRHQCSPTVRVP